MQCVAANRWPLSTSRAPSMRCRREWGLAWEPPGEQRDKSAQGIASANLLPKRHLKTLLKGQPNRFHDNSDPHSFGKSSLTISAKVVGIGAASQPLTLRG